MIIRDFTNDLDFLDPTYQFPVEFEGITYRCMYAAIVASNFNNVEDKLRIAKMDGYDALHVRPREFYITLDTVTRLADAKFHDADGYIQQMFDAYAPDDVEYVYENNIHDNLLGVCTCPRCKLKHRYGHNFLGRAITELKKTTHNERT